MIQGKIMISYFGQTSKVMFFLLIGTKSYFHRIFHNVKNLHSFYALQLANRFIFSFYLIRTQRVEWMFRASQETF